MRCTSLPSSRAAVTIPIPALSRCLRSALSCRITPVMRKMPQARRSQRSTWRSSTAHDSPGGLHLNPRCDGLCRHVLACPPNGKRRCRMMMTQVCLGDLTRTIIKVRPSGPSLINCVLQSDSPSTCLCKQRFSARAQPCVNPEKPGRKRTCFTTSNTRCPPPNPPA